MDFWAHAKHVLDDFHDLLDDYHHEVTKWWIGKEEE